MQAHSREITINVQDIVAALMKKGVSKKDIIENNWLDIQGIYSTVGWNVEYDCPGFDENYPSRYIFTPKRSR